MKVKTMKLDLKYKINNWDWLCHYISIMCVYNRTAWKLIYMITTQCNKTYIQYFASCYLLLRCNQKIYNYQIQEVFTPIVFWKHSTIHVESSLAINCRKLILLFILQWQIVFCTHKSNYIIAFLLIKRNIFHRMLR